MLQEGNPLAQSGAQLHLEPHGEHGTTQRAEPGISAPACSGRVQQWSETQNTPVSTAI